MEKENKTLNYGVKGMDKDTSTYRSNEQTYTHMLNGNLENLDGNGFHLQNEGSNLLCSTFKEGYKVINFEIDVQDNKVYYFLINPVTGCSEIGQIKNIQDINTLTDLEIQCGCGLKTILAEGLENIEQESTCVYETLLSDCCQNLELEGLKCLNFNLNYPISSALKNEKCGKVLYFVDDLNNNRRVELENLNQYFVKDVLCEEDAECEDCGVNHVPVCLNCTKLLIQPPFTVPCIDVQPILNGGNLKHGMYVFYAAYCDKYGAEMTRYMAVTGEVPIKDPAKNLYRQPELDAITNLGIKLEVNNLDLNYKYYKVAVTQKTSVDGIQSYFEVGVFPISDNVVVYTTENNKKRLTLEKIVVDFPQYTKAKYAEQVDNKLFLSDLESTPEVNLQPVVNLMGQFAKWRTVMAEEDLYKYADAVSKYRSNMRDENIPYAIRFFTNNGYVTANFPLISRAKIDDLLVHSDSYFDTDHQTNPQQTIQDILDGYSADPSVVPTGWKLDVLSVLTNSNSNCSSLDRIEKWQYYNTAIVEYDGYINKIFENDECGAVGSETVETLITKYCAREYYTAPIGTITLKNFKEGEIFTTFEQFLKDYSNDSDVDTRVDSFISSGLTTLYTQNLLTEVQCACGDPDTEDCDVPCLFDSDGNPITKEVESCVIEDLFPADICDTITLDESKSTIEFIRLICEDGVEITKTYADCDTYERPKKPNNCYIYKKENEAYVNLNSCCDDCGRTKCNTDANDCDSEPCCEWEYKYVVGQSGGASGACHPKNPVFDRIDASYGGETCSDADVLFLNNTTNITTHIVPMYTDTGKPSLLSTSNSLFTSTTVPLSVIRTGCKNNGYTNMLNGEFNAKVHSSALWFTVNNIPTGTGKLILKISDMNAKPSGNKNKDCLLYSELHRITVFENCDTTNPVASCLVEGVLPVVTGAGYTAGVVEVTNAGIICIDLELLDNKTNVQFAIDTPIFINPDATNYGYTTGTAACFTLEVSSAIVTEVTIVSDKRLEYEKQCAYTAQCDLTVYEEVKCEPVTWSQGKFAYVESTEKYPNNPHLFDSSTLIINTNDIPLNIKDEFEEVFTDGEENGNYVLKASTTDFSCKPIRHFKYPDNCKSPIHDGDLDSVLKPAFSKNKIFPLGFYLDNEIIHTFLNVAVRNGLITQEFRDSIVGYELFIGNITLNRSIIGKGLLYDMYQYEENGETVNFANFPYNNLGKNKLLYKDNSQSAFIDHPYNSTENDRFTFHSPDFSYDKPTIPFELKVESFELGNSRGRFAEVEGHPKMVLMTSKAEDIAKTLAGLEEAFLIITKTLDALVTTGTGTFAIGVSIAAIAATLASELVASFTYRGAQKTYEWLKIFDENGIPHNMAAYYASEGWYNKFLCQNNPEGNNLRGLQSKIYLGSGRYTFDEKGVTNKINHYNRESTVYLNMGEDFKIKHPSSLKTYDNSRVNTSGCQFSDGATKTTPETRQSIYSPYVSLKNYVPAQHGVINSVKWISTNYCGNLREDNKCDVVFGGDTFISRHAIKRKFPMFISPMLDEQNALASLTPFSYTIQRNIGFPKYYVDYKTITPNLVGLVTFPPIKSDYNLDCEQSDGLYVKETSKFFLYYYGIPSFLCESRINSNYRHGENNKERDFWGNQNDYIQWTQEQNVGIKHDNFYFYNPTYSSDNNLYGYRILPIDYDPIKFACGANNWDRTIYSLEDNNEQDQIDSWRIFLANNFKDFGNKYGTFYGVKPIESLKVIGRFENGFVIFNSYNTIQGTAENLQVGDGDIFKTRPSEFSNSELGYGGTQHAAWVSCEHGHFWADAKRGRVHAVASNGTGAEEISRQGMRNWFRENLPFNILKQFPNMPPAMIDNAYKGIGIIMGWDSRFERLFVTKKDVRVKPAFAGRIKVVDLDFYLETEGQDDEIVMPTDNNIFEDLSWTMAYSPVTKSWVSFYSFKPNYFIPFQNYFQTGLNWGVKSGVWSHLLTDNTSFQVFYGDLYPWKIEIPFKSEMYTKSGQDVTYTLETLRYENTEDYKNIEGNFNYVTLYNNLESTGKLNLITQKPNVASFLHKYPKHNVNDSIDILATHEYQDWSFNYLYDNVRPNTNLPLWLATAAIDDKSLNNVAYDYRPTFKNILRGKYFLARFVQEKESRLKFIYKWSFLGNKLTD